MSTFSGKEHGASAQGAQNGEKDTERKAINAAPINLQAAKGGDSE